MRRFGFLIAGLVIGWLIVSFWWKPSESFDYDVSAREEVIFWHFWGGADRDVVDDVVRRFNQSQSRYHVRAVAMPGNNMDVKLFLAITGGDPPDLVNQDDPIVADWASRNALMPLDEFALESELDQLNQWLFPAAGELGRYNGRMYALCNGLDIRALFYNRTMLDDYGLEPPETLEQLDEIAATIAPPEKTDLNSFGYLPDSRRLWAWGYAFGGRFVDPKDERPTIVNDEIVAALEWMAGYSRRYGPERVAAFRSGDQSLPGKTFPLLPIRDDQMHGRYALMMDGQWRCRDIDSFQNFRRERGVSIPEFGVCALPKPPGGLANAGWVNGNFFIVPRGANCPAGAWEFMKFWSGYGGNERQAAQTCAAGGWIPVSQKVVDQADFQEYLAEHELFAKFVELASSPHQRPVPVIPGAPFLNREVKQVAERAMTDVETSPRELLQRSNRRLIENWERLHGE